MELPFRAELIEVQIQNSISPIFSAVTRVIGQLSRLICGRSLTYSIAR